MEGSNSSYSVIYPPGDISINPEWGLDSDEFDYVYYHQNLDEVQQPWTDDPFFLPTTIVYSLAFLVGILGNLTVVFALVADKKAHNVTNAFLVSLAVADLLFLFVCIPYETVARFSGYLSQGRVFCKVAGFVEMLSAAASIWNLTIVSIERYIVIVHPMKSRTLCTFGRTTKIIVIVWFAAGLMSIPYSHIRDANSQLLYNNESYVLTQECSEFNVKSNMDRIAFAWYQLLVMFVVPTLIMAYCYAVVIRVLWLSTQELAKMTGAGNTKCRNGGESSQYLQPPPANRHNNGTKSKCTKKALKVSKIGSDQTHEMKEARKQVIKMLLTIIIVFLICWGPKLILNVMRRHELDAIRTPFVFYFMLVTNLLPYLQSATNPVIYSFMSNNFRRSMRTAVQRHCGCCTCFLSENRGKETHHIRMHSMKNSYNASSTSGYSTQTTAYNMD